MKSKRAVKAVEKQLQNDRDENQEEEKKQYETSVTEPFGGIFPEVDAPLRLTIGRCDLR